VSAGTNLGILGGAVLGSQKRLREVPRGHASGALLNRACRERGGVRVQHWRWPQVRMPDGVRAHTLLPAHDIWALPVALLFKESPLPHYGVFCCR